MQVYKKNLSAYLNFLQLKYERYTGAVELESTPYFMSADPSSFCNLKCPFCPTGVENHEVSRLGRDYYRKRALMPFGLFDALLGELGEYIFILFLYNWGEPLLNKELPAMVNRAKSYDIFTQAHSNLGIKISDGYIEELLLSGIDELCLSIDGFSQEVYEKYRRGGDLSLVLKNLERVVRTRDRLGLNTYIEWGFLAFRHNEHQAGEIMRYCRDLGIMFRQRKAFIDVKEHPDWLPGRKTSFMTMLRKPPVSFKELLEKGREYIRRNPSKFPLTDKEDRTCAWHYSQSIVNADGTVSPCCALWDSRDDFGKFAPGASRFRDIWNNGHFRSARAGGLDTVCGGCSDAGIKNLYTVFDFYVKDGFRKAFAGSEPVLAEAFRLLDKKNKFVAYYRANVLARAKRQA